MRARPAGRWRRASPRRTRAPARRIPDGERTADPRRALAARATRARRRGGVALRRPPFARVDEIAADALGVTLRALLRRTAAQRASSAPARPAGARSPDDRIAAHAAGRGPQQRADRAGRPCPGCASQHGPLPVAGGARGARTRTPPTRRMRSGSWRRLTARRRVTTSLCILHNDSRVASGLSDHSRPAPGG